MGLKNRILRRDPEPAIPIAADATVEHPLPAPAEPAPQGDALTAVFDPCPSSTPAASELADPEHAAQGDPLVSRARPTTRAGRPRRRPPGRPRRPRRRRRWSPLRRAPRLPRARRACVAACASCARRASSASATSAGSSSTSIASSGRTARLVQGKVSAIDAADRELRDDRGRPRRAARPYEELFVAGVSACQRCGALHGSDARFCPQCGLAFSGPRAGRRRVDRRGRSRPASRRSSIRRRRRTRSAHAAGVSLTPVTPPDAAPVSEACPRCGEPLAPDQDWCLRCGDPARTVIAATPRWRRPILAILALAAVALGVLTASFIGLTNDDPPPPRTIVTTTTLAPGASPPPGDPDRAGDAARHDDDHGHDDHHHHDDDERADDDDHHDERADDDRHHGDDHDRRAELSAAVSRRSRRAARAASSASGCAGAGVGRESPGSRASVSSVTASEPASASRS